MNSVGEECTNMKKDYDACFNHWFTQDFLKGNHDDKKCADLFIKYQQCVKNAMKSQNISMNELEHYKLGSAEEQKKPSDDKPPKS